MPEEDLRWRGEFENGELNALHAEAFGHPVLPIDWTGQVRAHSLGWVTARNGAKLVGFVDVAWDGGVHAFILDTMVTAASERRGIGTRLVVAAEAEAPAAGCEWLHVDFDACGFRTTPAGVIALDH